MTTPQQPPFRQQRRAARTATRTRQRAQLATKGAAFTPEGAALAGADIGARAARDAGQARLPTGNRRYQGVILAEFLVAALIVALAPLARGKAAQDQSSGPSPYGVDDVKQLAGIGAVYFVLALLSSGKYGRYSAWFGGLVLIAIGLSQTTSGGLPAIFGIFKPAAQSAGPPSDSTGPAAPGPQPGLGSTGSGIGPGGYPIIFTAPGVVTTNTGTSLA